MAQACGERIITPSSTACPPTKVSSPLSRAGRSCTATRKRTRFRRERTVIRCSRRQKAPATRLPQEANAIARDGLSSILWGDMLRFAQTCDAIAATTKKLQKTAIVAEYLKSRTIDESAVSAVFLSGSAFAAWEETTLQIGGSILWRLVAELSGRDESVLTAAYRKYGDLGTVAGEMLAERSGQGLTILEVDDAFRQIAAARGFCNEGRADSGSARASQTARSQIHCKNYDGRFADWTERKSGRGGNSEGLRCHPRGGAASQHVTRRHWGDAEVGGLRSAC